MSPQDIDLVLPLQKESEHLEFKEAKTQFDTSNLCKYCVALANEGGGRLFLGITDTPPRKIVGTAAYPDLSKIKKQIFDRLHFRIDVEQVNHPDGRVLVFHIGEFSFQVQDPSRSCGVLQQSIPVPFSTRELSSAGCLSGTLPSSISHAG